MVNYACKPSKVDRHLYCSIQKQQIGTGARMTMKSFGMMVAVGVSLFLASCGATTVVTTYTIGGTVYGLAGTGLVLQDNAGDNLPISSNGGFIFATALASGAKYSVTVLTQPSSPAQTCAVTNPSGTALANVSSAVITCNTNTFTVGVVVSGLTGTNVVLQDNGGDNLSVNANGTYTFANAISRGSTYSVTVLTQPSAPAQTCGVTNSYGTVTIANIIGIQVNCFPTTVTDTIGVTVTGLTVTAMNPVVLQDNGGDNLSVTANGSFNFPTAIANGSTYSVTVLTQPSSPAQTCSVTVGSGTAIKNVSGIPVNCIDNDFNIGVTVSGLPAGTSVVLQDNGGDNLTVSANSTLTNFATPIARGATYAVTVLTQPTGATCSVGTNATGTVTNANINVAITCNTILVAGIAHTCAVTKAGSVSCWGANESGQLGNGTMTQSSVPVEVLDATGNATLSDVVGIAAGQSHTCAITRAGSVWCWGLNGKGQLGNGAATQSSLPVEVLDPGGKTPLSGAVAISASLDHTCAMTSAGASVCWGDNAGRSNAASTTTLPATLLEHSLVAIAAGASHTCAVTRVGTVWCWGLNEHGQLGDGTVTTSPVPVQVVGVKNSGFLQLF
jgi:Regulator of chromosome condensation (RCC1) repeat